MLRAWEDPGAPHLHNVPVCGQVQSHRVYRDSKVSCLPGAQQLAQDLWAQQAWVSELGADQGC
jgi:hypothetical protein